MMFIESVTKDSSGTLEHFVTCTLIAHFHCHGAGAQSRTGSACFDSLPVVWNRLLLLFMLFIVAIYNDPSSW